jgi:hypothetical protein
MGLKPLPGRRGAVVAVALAMAQRPLLPWLFALTFCLTNAACGPSSEEEPHFGPEEMKAAVVGKWTGTLALHTAQPASMALTLEYAAPGSSPACSNRTFGMAPTCIDVTTMGLKGSITTTDGKFDQAAVTGIFEVFGLELRGGQLQLVLPGDLTLSARQTPAGFEDCKLRDTTGEAGTCTLSR